MNIDNFANYGIMDSMEKQSVTKSLLEVYNSPMLNIILGFVL